MILYRLQALCALQLILANSALAFTSPATARPAFSTKLQSSETEEDVVDTSWLDSDSTEDHMNLFEIKPVMETVQGGGTVKTYKMPIWAERLQYVIKSEGRPLKAMAQLWIGPIRNVHTCEIDNMNGALTPVRASLKFKKVAPTLKISTQDSYEFPIQCGVYVPPPERAALIEKNTLRLWKMASPDQKQLIQGGSTLGGGGSIRSWDIPTDVDQIQIISWSGDVGKKSFKFNFEILQAPNNGKQSYFMQCGGGTQPYHGVFQTPGPGWIVRLKNNKFVEDGLFQLAVFPYNHPTEKAGVIEPLAARSPKWFE